MPLATASFFNSPDLDGLDPLGTQVGVATSVQVHSVAGATDYVVSGGAFSGSLDFTTGGDITDVPINDFNYAGNVITYQLDSASQGLLPPGGVFGGKVLGYDATDQIYLVDQYAGFTATGGTPPATGTFVANGFTANHYELIGLCNGSGVENAAACPGGDALTLDQQYALDNHSFTFVQAPEPASGSIIAAALGIAYCVGRLKRLRAPRT
jgi:hypothetical protein